LWSVRAVLSRREMTTAASSCTCMCSDEVISGHQRSSEVISGHQHTCACTSSDESIEHRGCIPPAAAIASPAVELPARCQSVRAAAACVAKLPFERSSMRGGMPFERVMRPVGKHMRRLGEHWHAEGRDAIRAQCVMSPWMLPEAIRGNQRQSEAIRGNLMPFEAM
jgi:hypothetical protein